MKSQILLGVILLAGWITGCQEDNNNADIYTPQTEAEKAFALKYPDAVGVEWETHGEYEEVDFLDQNREMESWFYKDGTWLLTSGEISYTALPGAVTAAITQGMYGSWMPDNEAKTFEEVNGDLQYQVEVYRNREERELWYSKAGDLLREITEEYDGNNLPVWMKQFLQEKYVRSLEIGGEKLLDGRFAVYVLTPQQVKTAWFSAAKEWEYTVSPVHMDQVPAVVKDVLGWEAYKDYTVSEAEYRETPSGEWYRFGLIRPGSVLFHIEVTPQGQLVLN